MRSGIQDERFPIVDFASWSHIRSFETRSAASYFFVTCASHIAILLTEHNGPIVNCPNMTTASLLSETGYKTTFSTKNNRSTVYSTTAFWGPKNVNFWKRVLKCKLLNNDIIIISVKTTNTHIFENGNVIRVHVQSVGECKVLL